MTTAPRGRSLTRSLPVERDSILDGSCCASAAFQLFINLFVDKKRNKKTECAISFSLNVQYKPFLVKVQLHCRHFSGRV